MAVRLRNPLIVRDRLAAAEWMDALLRAAPDLQDIRAAILAQGYDGVVVEFAPGDAWVVAFRDDQVKLVRER